MTGTNPTTNPLQGFTITDNLPPQLSMVQDGSPNVIGTANPPVSLSWRPTGGAFQTVPVTGGGAWSATVPATADEVQASYGDVPVNFSASFAVRAGIPANSIDRNGQPIPADSPIQNCVNVAATGAIPRASCTTQTVVPLSVQFSKERTSAPVVAPGGEINWSIGLGVDATSADVLSSRSSPTACRPGPTWPNRPTRPTRSTAPPPGSRSPPTLARTPAGCGTGQVLLTWSWPAGFTLPRGQSGTITVNSRVALDASPASVVNTAVLNATNLTAAIQRTAPVAITSTTLLLGFKQVQGNLDPAFVDFEHHRSHVTRRWRHLPGGNRQHQRHPGDQPGRDRHAAHPW